MSGAYCLSIYGNHPYVLLNYNNSLGSVSTLAHELGHAVYEYMSSKNQVILIQIHLYLLMKLHQLLMKHYYMKCL